MKVNTPSFNAADLFEVKVSRTLVPDDGLRVHYEFSYTVQPRPTPNEFVNRFAELVCRYGKCSAGTYAAQLGVTERQLKAALPAISGFGIQRWTDAYCLAIGEALLRETNWPTRQVAKATRLASTSSFCHFFRKMTGESPFYWRLRNQ
ncbi:MAG: AraC family transcriptional regulator [Prevotellaceae bacterium]|jgi:AraC-like DNA-binding protein|nr:AraC family transcriptional regulator [Prevotellaceae bacterium]